MKTLYLILAIVGLVLPFSQFIPWLTENGLNILLLWQQISQDPLSSFAWLDVAISAIVVLLFILFENKRNPVRYYGLAIVGTFTVGVSFGLPLFLYLRELANANR